MTVCREYGEEKVPMNAAGKILKYKLREDLAAKYGS